MSAPSSAKDLLAELVLHSGEQAIVVQLLLRCAVTL